MAPVKGKKKSAVGEWIDGKVINFKKSSKEKGPDKSKIPDPNASVTLKRLNISIHKLPGSPNSPHRASMRRTRRMSMAPVAARAPTTPVKKTPSTSKIPKSVPSKSMTQTSSAPVAKMVASSSPGKPNMPPAGHLPRSRARSSTSMTRQSRTITAPQNTEDSSSHNESWIEQITSPKVFYRVSSPGKLMGAQRRKSYSTNVVQVELQDLSQPVHERSESPVLQKKIKVKPVVKKPPRPRTGSPSYGKRTTRTANSASKLRATQEMTKSSSSASLKNLHTSSETVSEKSTRSSNRRILKSSENKSAVKVRPFRNENKSLALKPDSEKLLKRARSECSSVTSRSAGASPTNMEVPAKRPRRNPRDSESELLHQGTNLTTFKESEKISKQKSAENPKLYSTNTNNSQKRSNSQLKISTKSLSLKRRQSSITQKAKSSPTSGKSPSASPPNFSSDSERKTTPALSPSRNRTGALTRSARRRSVKRVTITGASPSLTDKVQATPKPTSLDTEEKKTNNKKVPTGDQGSSSPQLSRYLSRGVLIPPSPVGRLVRASRANPFTPKPEAVPSKLLQQTMKKKITSEISLNNMPVTSLMDSSIARPVTPTRLFRTGALVSRSTPASSPSLPATPPSAKYASRSLRMVATARRNISGYTEDNFSPSVPRNSTPHRSSPLYASYLSSSTEQTHGNGTKISDKEQHCDISSAEKTVEYSTSSQEYPDFTTSVTVEEERSEVLSVTHDGDCLEGKNGEKENNVSQIQENGAEQEKTSTKKSYCSLM
ncbi:flocculation protein FLO11-like [Hyalella azteca]|uniref:Flocculation protein FLO11-like n=1 Tax=Hyalella azteca TaxID=294128 RepID=A0A8B7NNW2_HYAAZ|nr:flocculation protein FLO11-like [Hyalella azteca]